MSIGGTLVGAAKGIAVSGGVLVAASGALARRIERRSPPVGCFVGVSGARLHYVDVGSGPPVVLVHGLAGASRHFTFALADLLKQDFRLLIVDRPGSGYSTYAASGARSLFDQARIIGSFIRSLNLAKPLVVGHSLGGAIALALAEIEPALVGGLALVAPLSRPVEKVPSVLRPLTLPPLLRDAVAWTLSAPMGLIDQHSSIKAIFMPDKMPIGFGDRGGGALSSRPAAFREASRDVRAALDEMHDITGLLGTIDVPTGVLFGRGDSLLSPELHGRKTAQAIREASFDLVEGGHMLPLTKPLLVANWIRAQHLRMVQKA